MTEKQLLQMAAIEIKSLRRREEIQSARLDMFDSVMNALHGQPATNRYVAMMDVVCEIEKHLAEKE